MPSKVSAVIPAYNESSTIAEVVRVVYQVPDMGEVIVVSDGSTDATAEEARTAGARLLELTENRGKGDAIAAGIAQAQYEVVLLLDADLIGLTSGHVHDLIRPVLAGEADMTVGVFTQGKRATDLAQRIAPFLSGQRALRRSVFSGLRLEGVGYGLEIALSRWAAQTGLTVRKVPLAHLTHSLKEGKWGPVKGIQARLQMYWEIARNTARCSHSHGQQPEVQACLEGRASSRRQFGLGRRVGLLVTLVLPVILTVYGIQVQRAVAEPEYLPDLPAEAVGPRILIVAPHPDDETLGVAGLIQGALLAGSEVRVIFMTNGDGFRRGAQEEYSQPVLKPQDYISYGQLRQQEALEALGTLGLPRQQATFLGYPDGGLAIMWERHWDPSHPYTSRYTKHSASPYKDSYQPETPYTAVAVLSDLERFLEEFRPTQIFLPHPDDTHPDHWATNAFVSAATVRLELTFRPEMYNYIIHRGTWQVIPGVPRTAALKPPADVQNGDTIWYRYPLPPGAVAIKQKAIKQYHSQLKLMREFLLNFARPNEIFGSLAVRELPAAEEEFTLNGNPQEWVGISPVVSDPKGDTLVRRAEPLGDLKALYLAQDQDRLYLRVDTWVRLMKPFTYRVYLYVLPTDGNQQLQRWVLKVQPGSKLSFRWEEQPEGTTDLKVLGGIGKNTFEVALPANLHASAGDKLMVSAESRLGRVVLDKTPWWVVSVPR